jgi:microcystin-dependent protein
MCDGSAQSRTAFPDLFAKIGTTFGPGNGTTTFNLPDYRDRALMGAGPTNALGTQPGSASHTHQVPAHAHFVPAHSHAVPAHSHTCGATPNFIYVNWHGGDPDYFAVSGHTHPIDGGATNTLPQARFSTENTGPLVTDATSNLQPSATLNVQIKT